eukprot:403508-Lingulodinium_polyedra.AAC.1
MRCRWRSVRSSWSCSSSPWATAQGASSTPGLLASASNCWARCSTAVGAQQRRWTTGCSPRTRSSTRAG